MKDKDGGLTLQRGISKYKSGNFLSLPTSSPPALLLQSSHPKLLPQSTKSAPPILLTKLPPKVSQVIWTFKERIVSNE